MLALTVGQSHQKPLLTKQLWFIHNIGNRKITVNKLIRFSKHEKVTNTKANATLVTEHNFSGYVLFNLFIFVFHVISVNVDFVLFCK